MPLFEGTSAILSLAFVEATPAPGKEILIGTSSSVELVASDGTSSVIAAEQADDLAAADIDEDGDDDIVLLNASATPATLRTLLGDGTGGFIQAGSAEISATTFELGDVDDDGHIDLISDADETLAIRLGLGDGTFVDAMPAFMNASIGAIIFVRADDAMGHDIAFSVGTGAIRTSTGPPQYSSSGLQPSVLLASPHALAAGDYDGNGFMDVSAIDATMSPSPILTWNGTNLSADAQSWQSPTSYLVAAVGDVDDDGRDDLALVSEDGELAVRFGQAADQYENVLSCYVAGTVGGGTATLLAIGDVDGNGRDDVISAAGATLWRTQLE
jgi:hypothetical protein